MGYDTVTDRKSTAVRRDRGHVKKKARIAAGICTDKIRTKQYGGTLSRTKVLSSPVGRKGIDGATVEKVQNNLS